MVEQPETVSSQRWSSKPHLNLKVLLQQNPKQEKSPRLAVQPRNSYRKPGYKYVALGTSLVVPWIGVYTSTVWGMGLVLGWETKILHTAW